MSREPAHATLWLGACLTLPLVAALETTYRDRDPVVIAWQASPTEAAATLAPRMPRHACFVARPEEATRAFVADVHRLTRSLDDDPYADVLWGILTGFDATNALAIAETSAPLVVRSVTAGTEDADRVRKPEALAAGR